MINMTNRELFLLGFNPKLTKSDLTKKDDMFYVGHIVDVDSDGYVNEETAQFILTDYNRSI